jgi:uncharacterized protein (DUF1684 family)
LEDFVEHRRDLEDILLSGLPDDEREHVVEIITETSDAEFHRLRTAGLSEQLRVEARRFVDETEGDEVAFSASVGFRAEHGLAGVGDGDEVGVVDE